MKGNTVDAESPRLDVYTVTEISEAIRQHLECEFPRVNVLGETANFKAHTSGHWYFTLRDNENMLSVVVFRRTAETLSFVPGNGMMVVASGRLSHFGGQGRTQLIAADIVPAGKGALELEFRRLLEKLMREGLTAAERKRALPAYPERIVVITSPTGAVIRDICDTLARRWPLAKVIHICAEVQGPTAAKSIVRAFVTANGMKEVDAVILARGGGSIEDLWTFNLEEVARAVSGCVHPVVTGIGHEIDTTVVDYVADVRAATPTAAAELVTPLAGEVERLCARFVEKLNALCVEKVASDRHLVEYLLRSSAFPALVHRVERGQFELDDLAGRLGAWWETARDEGERTMESRRSRLEQLASGIVQDCESALGATVAALSEMNPRGVVRMSRDAVWHLAEVMRMRVSGGISFRRTDVRGAARALRSLDPRRVLERGYTFCTDPAGRTVISRSVGIARGDRMMVNFHDGRMLCAVERKRKGAPWRKR